MIHGLTNLNGAGDLFAIAAKLTARMIDAATRNMPYGLHTNLTNCGGCQERREQWNKAIPFDKTNKNN